MNASFHIRRDGRCWVVEEEAGGRQIGGIFATLVAALSFVEGEARRFPGARAIVDLWPRADAALASRAG